MRKPPPSMPTPSLQDRLHSILRAVRAWFHVLFKMRNNNAQTTPVQKARPSEVAVHKAYATQSASVQRIWRAHAIHSLAQVARRYILSIEPILVDPAIGDLSKPELRQASVPEASAIAKIVNELVQPNTPFRATLADECKKVPVGPPKGDNLRALLAPLVQSELQDPGYAGILASISEPEIYSCLADFMSQELLRSKVSGGATSESLILNYAILISHI